MKPKIPAPQHVVGSWFNDDYHTPKVDGRIESSIGDRSGDVFPGRCYKGGDAAYVSCPSSSDIYKITKTGDSQSFSLWYKASGSQNAFIAEFSNESPINNLELEYTNEVYRLKLSYRNSASDSFSEQFVSVSSVDCESRFAKIAISVTATNYSSRECQVKLYIDDKLEATFNSFGLLSKQLISLSLSQLLNGANGCVWDVREYEGGYEPYIGFEPTGSEIRWYTCEEGDGTISYDSSGNRLKATVVDSSPEIFHATDEDVPYSFLNEKGYTPINLIDTQEIKRDTNFSTLLNLPDNGVINYPGFNNSLARFPFAISSISYSASFWINNLCEPNGDLYNLDGTLNIGNIPNNQTAGFYDDNDGKGYYAACYQSGLTFNFRDLNPHLSTGKFKVKIYVEKGGYLRVYNNDAINVINGVVANLADNDPNGNLLVPVGNSYSMASLKALYDQLKTQNRQNEIDDLLLLPGVTYDEVYQAALDANGGVANGSWMVHNLMSYARLDLRLEPGLNVIENDSLVFNSTRVESTYYYGKEMVSIDNFYFTSDEAGLSKLYIDDFKIEGEVKIPFNSVDSRRDAKWHVLNQKGKIKYPIQLVEANCFKGDGVASVKMTNTRLLKQLSFIFIDNDGKDQALIGAGDSDNRRAEIVLNNTTYFYRWNGKEYYVELPASLETNDFCVVDVSFDEDIVTNPNLKSGVTFTNVTQGWDVSFSDNGTTDKASANTPAFNRIGSRTDDFGTHVNTSFCKFFNVVDSSGIVIPLSEGKGTSITRTDGTSGSIINAANSDDIWDKQNVYHYNAWEGLYENTVDIAEEDWTIIEVDTSITDADSSDSNSMTMYAGEDIVVDWGDGLVELITAHTRKEHTYIHSGIQQIKFCALDSTDDTSIRLGWYPYTAFADWNPDHGKVKYVNQFGRASVVSASFCGCSNLEEIKAVDTPDFRTDISYAFMDCANLMRINNLSAWDTSHVEFFSSLFSGCQLFDGVGLSDLSFDSALDLNGIFNRCKLINPDCSNWNFDRLTKLSFAFRGCSKFEGIGLSGKNTSNVNTLQNTFNGCILFTEDISNWDVSSVTNFYATFRECLAFNVNLSTWDVSSALNVSFMFYKATQFNNGDASNQESSPLSWNVSSAADLSYMFYETPFNQDISNWDTSGVTNTTGMFQNNNVFNQDLSSWNMGSVAFISGMFYKASSFNNGESTNNASKPLTWDVGQATSFSRLFAETSFNQELKASNGVDDWDVSNVTNMYYMFHNSQFNQYVGAWATSSVTSMRGMFQGCSSFNNGETAGGTGAPLNWDVSSVTNMSSMFEGCSSFNQKLNASNGVDGWDTSYVTTIKEMFFGCSAFNNGGASGVSGAPLNWNTSSITDVSYAFNGSSSFNQNLSGWDVSNVTDASLFLNGATLFNNGELPGESTSPLTWDTSNVTSFASCFNSTASFNQELKAVNGVDPIDVSNCTTIGGFFYNANVFNQYVGDWDTSSCVNMSSVFRTATAFNNGDPAGTYTKPLTWDVSNVTNMSSMFWGASTFGQNFRNASNTGKWDVSKVESFSQFLRFCEFNHYIGDWDTSSATNMTSMMRGTPYSYSIDTWNFEGVTSMDLFMSGTTISSINYESLLVLIESQNVQNDVLLTSSSSVSSGSAGATARQRLIDDHNWIINDGGVV
jgi:surface protein